jgi:hypothetical protein
MERRRRVPRQGVGWPGTYTAEGVVPTTPQECKVLDISVVGAGLEIFGMAPPDLIGRRIDVEVKTPSSGSVTIRMAGEVRNVGPGPSGGVRLGIEFIGLSDTERSILQALDFMQVAW